MMKSYLVAVAVASAALATPALAKRGPSTGGLPAGAVGGIYTMLAPDQIAPCIAAAAGTTAQQSGESWSVAAPNNSFDIVEPSGSPVYRTLVVIHGTTEPTEISNAAIMCSAVPPLG